MKRIIIAALLFLFVCSGALYAGSNTPSGISVQTIVDRIRVDLNSPLATDSFFNDTDIVQWVNEAVNVINTVTQCMETTEQVVLSSGTMSYTISASHYDINHCIYDSGIANSPTRYSFLMRYIPGLPVPQQEPRPKFWREWESKLFVFPVPDDSLSGTTVHAYLNAKHAAITAVGDAISTPAYMDAAIIYYVKAKAHFKEKADAKGAAFMQLFNSIINENKRVVLHRDLAIPTTKEGVQ